LRRWAMVRVRAPRVRKYSGALLESSICNIEAG
jgi:hypothetical protein